MKIKNKFSTSWGEIFLSVAFFSFYLPQAYAVPGIVYKLWHLLRVAVSLVACVIYFFRFAEKMKMRNIVAFAFYTWVFVCTSALTEHGRFMKEGLLKCIGFIALIEVSFCMMSRKKVIKSFIFAGMLASILHFLSFIKYSDLEGGMRHGQTYVVAGRVINNSEQNWYFLTYDNYSIIFFLPVALMLLYYYYNYGSKKALNTYKFYIVFILYMFILKTAATAMFASFVFFALNIYYIKFFKNPTEKIPKIHLTYSKALIIGAAFSIIMLIVVGGSIAKSIGDYFGKDASFSGRDKIWANSIKYILKSPLIGYGLEPENIVWQKLSQTHCHNIFVELLYDGGLIAFVLFLAMIYMYRPKSKDTFSVFIFSSTVLCYIIVASLDWGINNPLSLSPFFFAHYLCSDSEKVTDRLTLKEKLFLTQGRINL